MINLLNNRVKRGELVNVSIILNGFENKAKQFTHQSRKKPLKHKYIFFY